MNRGFFDQAEGVGTTAGIEGQTVGIIGLGHIGGRLAEMLRVNRPKTMLYASAHRHIDQETALGVAHAPIDRLLRESDIVFLCVSGRVGPDFFGAKELAGMKPGALLVSFMVPGVINADALFESLSAGRLRAISDYPMDGRFAELPPSRWYSSRVSNAFNNAAGVRQTSDAAVRSLINLLTTGDDEHVVNGEYKRSASTR
jgi:lactate dehydrogenase-like 2-hydroxyacid dehydrogenase